MQLTDTLIYAAVLEALIILFLLLYVRRREHRGPDAGVPTELPSMLPAGRSFQLLQDDGSIILTVKRATRWWAMKSRNSGLAVAAVNEPWLLEVVRIASQVLTSGIMKNGIRRGVYKVTISTPGELMRARGGGLRGVVVDGKGRVTGHATLHQLSTAAGVGAIWQAVAFFTAQTYLVHIFRTLKSIEGGIAQIQRWLANERLAALQANSKMLEEIEVGLSLNNGFLANSSYYQAALAKVELDCSGIGSASLLDIEGYIDEASKLNLSGWLGANAESLYELLPRVTSAFSAAGFALVMRAYNTVLLSVLTSEAKIRDLRVKDLRQMCEEARLKLRAFEAAVEERISQLDCFLRSNQVVEEKRNEIRTAVRQALWPTRTRVESLPSAIESLSTAVERLGRLSSRPLTLCVTVDDKGQVQCRVLEAQ